MAAGLRVSLPALTRLSPPCRHARPRSAHRRRHRGCCCRHWRRARCQDRCRSPTGRPALQDQVLHTRSEPKMRGGKDRIVAFVRALDHRIAGIDEIDIVAETADHSIGPGVAIEQVVAGTAVRHVGEGIAIALRVVRACRSGYSTFAPSAKCVARAQRWGTGNPRPADGSELHNRSTRVGAVESQQA